MKKQIFLVSSLVFTSLAPVISFANHSKIIHCPQEIGVLSQMFERNWMFDSKRSSYSSYVELPGNDYQWSGNLHIQTTVLPLDHNPHLSYSDIEVDDIPHYGLWNIDCRYSINNSMLSGLGDGKLHMTTSVSDYDYSCKKINNSFAICDLKSSNVK